MENVVGMVVPGLWSDRVLVPSVLRAEYRFDGVSFFESSAST